MAITAKEIAAKLGLSEAAVSMALNNKPGVSTTTRKKVFETAHKLGYDFSRRAVSNPDIKPPICFVLYKKSGAVVADTPFFSLLSDGISTACKREHYNLVIKYLYEDDNLERQLYMLTASQFSGILLLATEMDEVSLAFFSNIKIPIVILDSYFETLDYNYILINNKQGAFSATNYLINKRKVQPGYLRSAYSISNFEERADGFYKAIRKNGMSASKSIVHRLTPSLEGAYADMLELIHQGEELATCYFADNDLIAIGAINAMKEAGYKIPDDIAVIGFDNLPLCELLDPPLATVHVPKQFMGEIAARQLIEIIEGKNTFPIKIEINTTLKKRKSV